ncbi:MAG: alpha/beta hydrolase [Treponema sp.]|nr:alpha/beta hydrolase [Treponema sp.]
MSEIVDRIRRDWKENDAKRDAGLVTPDCIERHDNIPYGSDANWQKLDIYRPKEAKGKIPVIVNVHGGAWVYGDKELYQFYCMDLARRGFALVNFTYRLCPEFQFPAQIQDTDLVFRFVASHANEYGLDTDRLFAVGDSAGAHLLGLYLCARANPDYAKLFPFEIEHTLDVKAAALNCGIYDVRSPEKIPDKDLTGILKELLPQGGTRDELEMISVTPHISPELPPLYVMTSTDDFLKDQAPPLVQKLCDANVPVTFRLYAAEGRKGKLYHTFHEDIRRQVAIECNDDECMFFHNNGN